MSSFERTELVSIPLRAERSLRLFLVSFGGNFHRAKLWRSSCRVWLGWVVDSCGVRIKSGKVAYCVINKSIWTRTAFPDLMRTPQLSTTHPNQIRKALLHSLALWKFPPKLTRKRRNDRSARSG